MPVKNDEEDRLIELAEQGRTLDRLKTLTKRHLQTLSPRERKLVNRNYEAPKATNKDPS